MDVVARHHPGEAANVLANVLDLDALWCGLQQDLGRGEGERKRRFEDDEGDEQGYGWIGVVLAGPVGQPDDEGCHNDADVAKGVAEDVKHHSIHAHVAMIVTMARLTRLAGLIVIVRVVQARVPSVPLRCVVDVLSVAWVALISNQRRGLCGRLLRDSVLLVGAFRLVC